MQPWENDEMDASTEFLPGFSVQSIREEIGEERFKAFQIRLAKRFEKRLLEDDPECELLEILNQHRGLKNLGII